MRVFICVLSAQTCINYKLLTKAQKETCFKSQHPDIAGLKFYFGTPQHPDTDLDWYFDCSDDLMSIGHKTIKAFERALLTEWDYLFRPNASLFVNQNKLIEWLQNKPRQNFASGINGVGIDKILFLNGSGYILSRDVVKLIVDNKDLWKHKYIDDVAISELMQGLGIVFDRTYQSMGIKVTNKGFDVWQNNDAVVSFHKYADLNDCEFMKDHFHIRVNNANGKDRNTDIQLMKELNKILL
jgi:hypothetical protein